MVSAQRPSSPETPEKKLSPGKVGYGSSKKKTIQVRGERTLYERDSEIGGSHLREREHNERLRGGPFFSKPYRDTGKRGEGPFTLQRGEKGVKGPVVGVGKVRAQWRCFFILEGSANHQGRKGQGNERGCARGKRTYCGKGD